MKKKKQSRAKPGKRRSPWEIQPGDVVEHHDPTWRKKFGRGLALRRQDPPEIADGRVACTWEIYWIDQNLRPLLRASNVWSQYRLKKVA